MKRMILIPILVFALSLCAYAENAEDGIFDNQSQTDTSEGLSYSDIMQSLAKEHKAEQWKLEHGYSFPIYGITSVDLSPISDYLTLLSENDIFINLPELNINSSNEEYDWIYSEIGDFFYLRYICYTDMSKYSMTLEVPLSYRPRDEAYTLLIVSVLSIDREDAQELYRILQYNVIDGECQIETDEYTLSYREPRLKSGVLVGNFFLTVEKLL